MYDNKLENKIKKLLEKDTDNYYKIKDIQQILHIRKHKRKDLIHTLQHMVKEKKIQLINRKYTIRSEPQLIRGTFDARPMAKDKTYAFVICDDFDIFVNSEDTLNAYHKDVVLVEVSYSKINKKYGKIISIKERNSKKFTGNIQKVKNQTLFFSDNPFIHTPFYVNDSLNAKSDEKVLLEVTNWGNRSMQKLPAGKVIEILGKAGEPEVELLSVVRQFELPLLFPDNVIKEANELKKNIHTSPIRKDLRDLLTFTIDPASAKDFDDAISLENKNSKWIAYTHIADVAEYVSKDSKIFKEAKNRGNSYYFPKKVIPMLPEILSNKICSLRPFEDKLTITVETHFDEDYHILNQIVYESVICSNARFSYEEIDTYFDGQSEDIDRDITQVLDSMKVLSENLYKLRMEKGYLPFLLPEATFSYDEKGDIVNISRSEETESHKLIENFMLLANEYIASFLSKNPSLYRIHDEIDPDALQNVLKIAKIYNLSYEKDKSPQLLLHSLLANMYGYQHRAFGRMILRNLKRAKYDTQKKGHFGLSTQEYTHFTSPIRRLCDLTIHHLIKAKLHNQANPFSLNELNKIANISTEKELIADESERELERRLMLKFMKTKIGNEYTGMIVGLSNSSLFIELDQFPISVRLPLKDLKEDYYQYLEKSLVIIGKRNRKLLRLADKIQVQITKIDDDIYVKKV